MTPPNDVPSQKITFNFLDKVAFTHTLWRTRDDNNQHVWKLDKPYHWQPHQGVIIGVRSLQNGYVEWNGDERYFVTTERIKAYLVAINMQRKPVLVLPEHLQAVE